MTGHIRCPKCGGIHVQLSDVSSKHGCFWFLIFGWIYLVWLPIKWCIGLAVLVCIDWWMAILKAVAGKGYVWKCKGWFSGTRKVYYCHECGHNFKG